VAFRTRRRRKPRVIWMPTYGGLNPDASPDTTFTGIRGVLNVDTEEVIYDAFPLTFDYSFDANLQQQAAAVGYPGSLHDIVSGNEWKLRRIVGKCFLWASGDETDSPVVQAALVDVAVGFIVCNTEDDGSPTTDFNTCNPLSQEGSEDPWIWRRRWLLNPYNPPTLGTDTSNIGFFANSSIPQFNGQYGSVADGPHIDQKTSRRIHRSQRLFCVIATRPHLVQISSDFAAYSLQYLLDYRLLGSLAPRSAGNRGNAAR